MRDKNESKEFFDASITLLTEACKQFNPHKSYEAACLREQHGVQKISPLTNFLIELPQTLIPKRYSRGDNLMAIQQELVLPLLDDYIFYVQEMKKHNLEEMYLLTDQTPRTSGLRGDGPECRYHSVYTWLCWFICFGGETQKIAKVAPFLGRAGKDRLIDTIIKHYQPNRIVAKTCMNPETFGLLDQVIDADTNERPALVKKYLDEWPRLIGHLRGLHSIGVFAGIRVKDRKTLIDSIDSHYQGFWAWEAALVVKFFNIDDSSFKDHEFYPYDLVHFLDNH
ncbi:hypothetical protein MAH1_31140 [Sessilibacter sp. MAH1]